MAPPKPITVLLIDDEELARVALERLLRRSGYRILQAAAADEGLAIAKREEPNVIFVDIRMPGMDGHTFLRRLEQHRLSCAAVLMSGGGTMEDVVDAVREGAVDYLKKPFSHAEVLEVAIRALRVHDDRVALRKQSDSAGNLGGAPPLDSGRGAFSPNRVAAKPGPAGRAAPAAAASSSAFGSQP